ncbi:MAG: ribose-phosphate diphosphokinase, partial [Gemmatimonadota bacterium]
AIIDKRRSGPNVAEVVNVVGEVAGKRCLITDDMIDTAGTMVGAVRALWERGAKEVYCLATHALLSGPAIEGLNSVDIAEITVTDTIRVSGKAREGLPNLKVLSVANLLARAIENTHYNRSVSSLFV